MTDRAFGRCIVALALACAPGARADQAQDAQRHGLEMLDQIQSEIEHRYYDPAFHGIALKSHFDAARERMRMAPTESVAGAILAQTLAAFKDSHTYFIPPTRPWDIDYGIELKMIGDTCRIVSVDAGSDAERQHLVPGLAVVGLEGVEVRRENWPDVEYALFIAQPRRELRVRSQAEGDAIRATTVAAKVTPRAKQMDVLLWYQAEQERRRRKGDYLWRVRDLGADRSAVRLTSFDAEDDQVEKLFRKLVGKKGVVLDLRGNPGGLVDAMRLVAGSLFDREVEIATMKERKSSHPQRSRRSGAPVYTGPLAVLIDSGSASAAEILARVVQLEKRGTVLGDTSGGAVMESNVLGLRAGNPLQYLYYALSVTRADVFMKDGQSLERRGVVPDEVVLPSATDLRLKRDPVLARAAELVGASLSPEAAGRLFDDDPKADAAKK